MRQQIINFNPGPAKLPAPVLQQVQAELLDYQGSGISVLEMSHRSDLFAQIAHRSEQRLRQLLGLDNGWAVLFLSGGASSQFSLSAMNLSALGFAEHIITGHWSQRAYLEATKVAPARIAASSEALAYSEIPAQADWQLDESSGYVHITSNETIHGVAYPKIPEIDLPLVADMSSDFLSKPIDIDRFGLIYAGAQKNAGPAGLTFVLIKRSLLEHAPKDLPAMFNYRLLADKNSMLNTPPVFNWYVAALVLDWIDSGGGLPMMEQAAIKRSSLLYSQIDSSGFYHNQIAKNFRSRINVAFSLQHQELENMFLQQAQAAGMTGLKGHRAIGGLRASLYNAMPFTELETLVEFMREFESKYG